MPPTKTTTPEPNRVIGYLRVSTREQADSGAGLDAQRAAIAWEAERRGWSVTWIEDAGESGKNMNREGVQEALRLLKKRQASALVVAKLDRLSRSVQDFASTLDLARRQRWAVVALDLGVDTTTPTGKLVAHVLASVAEWEREAIGQRTRDALAARKAAGARLGRERMTDPVVVARIVAERGSRPHRGRYRPWSRRRRRADRQRGSAVVPEHSRSPAGRKGTADRRVRRRRCLTVGESWLTILRAPQG